VYVILYKITFLLTFFINEEKIMDKKTILGGAAALIMGAGLFAAPASAAIEISHSGEATLTAVMGDWCSVTDKTISDVTNGIAAETNVAAASNASTCASANEESPVWDTSSKLDWSAGGTLANGLSVSTSQDADINLSGAFGSLTFKKGGDSAAKSAAVNAAGDLTVVGDDLGGHTQNTSGTAGVVVTYAAPSMGGMDLYLSYAPNSGIAADGTPSDYDNATYTDTIGFGAAFAMDALSISAGWEAATADGSSCVSRANAGAVTAVDPAAGDLKAQADEVLGGAFCGDETLMNIGAAMNVGDIALNVGWSKLDTEEADKTTMNLGLGMDVGAYNLTVDYIDSTLDYGTNFVAYNDKQTVIGVGASTSLGDGVTLGLSFANNSYNIAGTGAHTNYRTEAELKVVY
jgi:hypothetical protein